MREVRTIRYDDGCWCEQEYVDDKLHGLWTVFHANGQKDWERQCSNDRKEGYQRTWDRSGRLIEEKWYHLDVLHGLWRTWDETGIEKVEGDFIYGYSKEAFESTVNEEFNQKVKLHFQVEPEECRERLKELLAGMMLNTVRMQKRQCGFDPSQPGSFWNHVNVLGVGEDWPQFRNRPLAPILQIDCSKIPLSDNPLSDFSFVTLFADGDKVAEELGEDLVVRAYRRTDKIVQTTPPCKPLDAPSLLVFSEEFASFPDENDLPPGLRGSLEDGGDKEDILHPDTKMLSRLGGWPGWLQWGTISHIGRFAFQVDSLDVEGWECGDCTIHYFFLDDDPAGFTWLQEMA